MSQDEPPSPAPRRLWPHLVLLAAILTTIAVSLGTGSSFITDEAFVRTQVRVLDDSGGWLMAHPFPEADPDGAAFPLHGAEQFDDGYVLYGKHPALIYVYVVAARLGGDLALVLVSVLGTVVAAGAAGALAARWHRSAGPIAVWLVGLASPLFFDSFVVHAHTLGAALAGLAVLAAIEYRSRPRALALVGLGAATAGLVLMRTEGVFFAAGLVIGMVAIPLRPWSSARVTGAAVAASSAVAALLVEGRWSASLGGETIGSVGLATAPDTSAIGTRTSALAFTWFLPGYRGLTPVEVLTAIAAVLLIVGTWLVIRRPDEVGARLIPVLGGTLLLIRSVLEPGAIPGLLIAFCLGWAGLMLVTRQLWDEAEVRFTLVVAAVYAAGVLATQYPAGGHTEWGGRYFALLVPLVGAVAAAASARWWVASDRDARRLGASAAALAGLGLAVLAVTTLVSEHDRNDGRVEHVLASAAALGPASDGGPTVVVTEDEQVPRLAEERAGEVRFLLVGSDDLEAQLERLDTLGIEDVLLVSRLPETSLQEIPASYEVVGDVVPYRLQRRDNGGIIHLQRTAT